MPTTAPESPSPRGAAATPCSFSAWNACAPRPSCQPLKYNHTDLPHSGSDGVCTSLRTAIFATQEGWLPLQDTPQLPAEQAGNFGAKKAGCRVGSERGTCSAGGGDLSAALA